MASENGGEYAKGEMDIEEHKQTFRGFMEWSKWLSLFTLAIVLWGTLTFAVTVGWLNALILTAVFMAAAYAFIRFFFPSAPDSH